MFGAQKYTRAIAALVGFNKTPEFDQLYQELIHDAFYDEIKTIARGYDVPAPAFSSVQRQVRRIIRLFD